MKDLFKKIDKTVDRLLATYAGVKVERTVQYTGAVVLIVLISLCTLHFVMRAPRWQVSTVQTDLHRIARAVKQLDSDCFISDMRVGLHPVEVLTHAQLPSDHFYIRLRDPKSWNGPYLRRVATLQDKPYQLLKTNTGLFVVPSEGVTLPSGLVIGEDIAWHAESDVASMAAAGGSLYYKSGPLAFEVLYGEAARKQSRGLLPKAAQQLSAWLAEFNQAMSFAQAQHQEVLV